ncbi:hypothetical protein KSS94_24535 [Pseudomonas fakonensis]|uniref:Uncharacterized protein n=1 Tax=Pseudomonas fakonensis TaxID=2842355 RepID=A0ABX8N401_9PSED|nr:hypothetical protein [Pseudomonas fakonensis]QXH51067.1 hypothetical protein KSS94_24535 [Pseudomonas fakonensis]
MIVKTLNKPKADNPHVEAAQRIRQLAQILSCNPTEARAFREMTGVFTATGELKESYR